MHTSTSYIVPNGDTSNRIVCLTITTDVTFPGTTGSVSTRHSSSDEHDPPSLQQNPYTWKCGISVRFMASNLLIPNFFRSILGWTNVAVFSTSAAQAEVASTALCFSRKPYTSTVHTVHRAPIIHQDMCTNDIVHRPINGSDLQGRIQGKQKLAFWSFGWPCVKNCCR